MQASGGGGASYGGKGKGTHFSGAARGGGDWQEQHHRIGKSGETKCCRVRSVRLQRGIRAPNGGPEEGNRWGKSGHVVLLWRRRSRPWRISRASNRTGGRSFQLSVACRPRDRQIPFFSDKHLLTNKTRHARQNCAALWFKGVPVLETLFGLGSGDVNSPPTASETTSGSKARRKGWTKASRRTSWRVRTVVPRRGRGSTRRAEERPVNRR